MSNVATQVLDAFQPLLSLQEEQFQDIGTRIPIPIFVSHIIEALCSQTLNHLEKQGCFAEIRGPVYVIGDIHGNIVDLIRLLCYAKPPPISKFLFLGDYVDRGEYSVEVCALLFALLCTYPNHVVLLRGNHEFASTNLNYGFFEEVRTIYQSDALYRTTNLVFKWLPIWAIVNSKIFAVHGGLSPDLTNLDQIRNLRRPINDYDNSIVSDLVWSDPLASAMLFDRSQRGSGVTFGQNAVNQFLDRNNLVAMVRGHQCVPMGVSRFEGGRLYTVFSCSMYEELGNNRAGLLFVGEKNEIEFFSLPPMECISRGFAITREFGTEEALEAPRMGPLSLNIKLSELSKRRGSQGNIPLKRKIVLRKRCSQTNVVSTQPSLVFLPPRCSTFK